MKVIETERLVVRHLRRDDLADLHEVCGDPEVARYVGDGRPLSVEQTRKWIEKSRSNYSSHGFGCFAVIEKESNRFIGYCGMVNPTSGETPEAEIIYSLKKLYWGRGLAGEAARAVLDFGFNRCGLRRVVATIDPANLASVRIVEKLGMKFLEERTDEHGLPEAVYAIEK